jgi:hypothetical protein
MAEQARPIHRTTPGTTPPELSVTTPEMLAALVPWAAAATGGAAMIPNATRVQPNDPLRLMVHLIRRPVTGVKSEPDALGTSLP